MFVIIQQNQKNNLPFLMPICSTISEPIVFDNKNEAENWKADQAVGKAEVVYLPWVL